MDTMITNEIAIFPALISLRKVDFMGLSGLLTNANFPF